MEEEGIRGEKAGKRKQRREGRQNRRYIGGTAGAGRIRYLSFILILNFLYKIFEREPLEMYMVGDGRSSYLEN